MQSQPVTRTEFPLPLFGRGKVRDTYDLGDKLLIVTTDRISAYDSILPTGIPFKGAVLNSLSAFWLDFTKGIARTDMLGIDARAFPFDWREWPEEQQEELFGRSMLVKKAERIDIECVARGYLAGSGWAEYKKDGRGHRYPAARGVAGERAPARTHFHACY